MGYLRKISKPHPFIHMNPLSRNPGSASATKLFISLFGFEMEVKTSKLLSNCVLILRPVVATNYRLLVILKHTCIRSKQCGYISGWSSLIDGPQCLYADISPWHNLNNCSKLSTLLTYSYILCPNRMSLALSQHLDPSIVGSNNSA